MKKLKLDFQHLGNVEVLTRSQLKKVIGGSWGSGGGSGSGGGELCMGCKTDQECRDVGKGNCRYYPTCNGGVKCCTGWTSC